MLVFLQPFCKFEKERWKEGKRERERDRQTDRQAGRQTRARITHLKLTALKFMG